jgi:hypothetical protein
MEVFLLRLDWRANNQYLPNSCVVLDRRIATQIVDDSVPDGGGGHHTAYHPEIKIQYEVGGRKYEVWTYDAIHRLYNDQAAPQGIVDGFQVGATYPCWYDPERPERAILVRGYVWIAHLCLIVPIVFLLYGGIGMLRWWTDRAGTAAGTGPFVLSPGRIHRSWKGQRKTAQQLGLEPALRPGGAALAAGPDRATVPTLDLSQSPGTTLPYRLRSSTRPGWTLLGCLFFTLVWNGVTAPFVVIMIAGRLGWSWAKPGPPWPIELVVILFAVAGLSAVAFLVYFGIAELLVAIRVGPTTVETSLHPLEPGEPFEVSLSQRARRTITLNSFRVVCVCEEEATRSEGKDARTETRRVYEEEMLARDRFRLRPNEPLEARAELRLPRRAMHSFQAVHNQVRWKLVVRGDVAGWPDFKREFPIVVQPSRGAPR